MGERRDAAKHTACASQPGTEVSTPRDGANAAERDRCFSPCKRTVVHGAYPGSHTQCLTGHALNGAPMMADVQRDKVVYFVRHGQSEDNVAPVFQSPDSPLSAVGRAQAARIAARASKLAFEVLLASPYRRAQETAEVIGNVTGKALELCELFTERVKPT